MKDGNIKLNRRHVLLAGAAALAAPSLLTSPAFAITPDEIKKRGKVIIGIQGDNPPWGFVNSSGKQEGLDADIGELFGKDVSTCCLRPWRCSQIAPRPFNSVSHTWRTSSI
jgi:polar amino acid transport system substrate-binding protein